jgi:hypothetical protein
MQTELSQYTAVIGIDWADKKHDVCVQDMATGKRRASQVRHRAEDLDAWARSLHRRFGGPIAVAVELSKGPIITVLQKYDFFVIFPVEPAGLASYRRAFALSGAKDDPTDAEFALKLLLSHAEHFKPLQPQSVEMRTLMTLVEQRRQLMNSTILNHLSGSTTSIRCCSATSSGTGHHSLRPGGPASLHSSGSSATTT